MVSLKVLFEEAMARQRRIDASKRNHSSARRSHNKTGFKYLCKTPNDRYRKGYGWRYQRTINNEHVAINATDLYQLFNKVRCRGYDWVMLDEEKAKQTVEGEGLVWIDFVKYMVGNGGYVDYS